MRSKITRHMHCLAAIMVRKVMPNSCRSWLELHAAMFVVSVSTPLPLPYHHVDDLDLFLWHLQGLQHCRKWMPGSYYANTQTEFDRAAVWQKMTDIVENLRPICSKVSKIISTIEQPITTKDSTEPKLY
jgi:hypothetical protein